VSKLFQDAGYLALNVSFDNFLRTGVQVEKDPRVRIAKTDYNFEYDQSIYDTTHWLKRTSGQPFFCQIQLKGGKLRGKGVDEKWPARVRKELGSATEPAAVNLPPYLPDDPVIRQDWSQYLNTVRYTDMQVGQIVKSLHQAGELENTLIFLSLTMASVMFEINSFSTKEVFIFP
jgi:arylsulfatase A-like enzyme